MNKYFLLKHYPVNILLTIILVMVAVTGCIISRSSVSVKPVPDYRFPNKPNLPNLRLLSIITDPYSKNFNQGTLLPAKKSSKNSFIKPTQVAIGDDSAIYILDNGRGVIYRMVYNDKSILTNVTILPKNKRAFPSAIDMIVTPDNKIWLTDSKINQVFILSIEGVILDSLDYTFSRPIGIVYHQPTRRILISDIADNSISSFDIAGNFIEKHNSSNGLELETPSFIAVDTRGNIYVNETLKSDIKVFSPDWKLEKIIGGLGDGPGYFSRPKGVAVDEHNRIYIVDALFDNIQIFNPDGLLLLTMGVTGSRVAEFWQPMGVTIDKQQRIFVVDSYNRRVQVFTWEKE